MEPMTLGSPTASPIQTPGSPGLSPTTYLPSFLLGDANTSARLNITSSHDTSRFTSTGGSGLMSPISHYGTPDYRSNRQKAMFGNVTSPGGTQIEAESHAGGPPTRGLFDTLETAQPIGLYTPTTNQNIVNNQSGLLMGNANNSMLLDNSINLSTNESSRGLLQWVTIFGFPPNALNTVLSHISSRVRIVDKRVASHAQSNWIHLKCASEQEAQRAFACNGNIVSGSIMIGVVPCTDEGVILNSENDNQLKMNGSMRLFSTPGRSTRGTPDCTNVPRSMIKIQNARPLAAGYSQHLSPQSVKSPENIPHRSTGFVSKAMDYVFGW